MNTVEWKNKARKQLLKITKKDAAVIVRKAGGLSDFPQCTNVKKLTNHACGYRLRVGNYRVLFDYDGGVKIITIEEVKKRDQNTY